MSSISCPVSFHFFELFMDMVLWQTVCVWPLSLVLPSLVVKLGKAR
jgi:hypothetical protein